MLKQSLCTIGLPPVYTKINIVDNVAEPMAKNKILSMVPSEIKEFGGVMNVKKDTLVCPRYVQVYVAGSFQMWKLMCVTDTHTP